MFIIQVESLKHLSTITIATSLWNLDILKDFEEDIQVIININVVTRYANYCGKAWEKIVKKVEGKVPELPLPDKILQHLARYVEPVGEQLLAWIYQNCKEFNCTKMLPSKIFWTSKGTINKVETAKAVLADETLTIFERFTLACFYCLEEFIRSFWERLTDTELISLRNQPPGFLLWLWPTDLDSSSFTQKIDEKISLRRNFDTEISIFSNTASYANAFLHAIGSGNELASRYFFNKLTDVEKGEHLMKIMQTLEKCSYYPNKMHGILYREVFHFLLVNLDGSQQITLMSDREFRTEILKCYLERLRLCSLLDVFELLSEHLEFNDVYCLIGRIFYLVNDYSKDYDYLEVYKNVWNSSPHCKGTIVDHLNNKLSVFLGLKSRRNVIRYTMEFADLESRKKIFLNNQDVLKGEVIREERWDDLRFFLELCDLPIRLLKDWQKTFVKPMGSSQSKKKLFEVLNDLIYKKTDPQT